MQVDQRVLFPVLFAAAGDQGRERRFGGFAKQIHPRAVGLDVLAVTLGRFLMLRIVGINFIRRVTGKTTHPLGPNVSSEGFQHATLAGMANDF